MCEECGNDDQTICRVPIARILERQRDDPNFMMYFCVRSVAIMLFCLYGSDINPNNTIVQNSALIYVALNRCSIQLPAPEDMEDFDVIPTQFIKFFKLLLDFAVKKKALDEQAGTNTWVWSIQWVYIDDVLIWLSDQGCPMDVDNEMCCFWIRAYMQGQAAALQSLPPRPPQPRPPQPRPPQPPQEPQQLQQLQQLQPLPAQPLPYPQTPSTPTWQQLIPFAPNSAHTPAPINNFLILNAGPLADLLSRGPAAQPAPPADHGRTERALELQRRFLDTCLKMNEAGASKDRYVARLQRICRSMEKLI